MKALSILVVVLLAMILGASVLVKTGTIGIKTFFFITIILLCVVCGIVLILTTKAQDEAEPQPQRAVRVVNAAQYFYVKDKLKEMGFNPIKFDAHFRSYNPATYITIEDGYKEHSSNLYIKDHEILTFEDFKTEKK